MDRTVCIIQGHPDRSAPHLCDAIAGAYADGARSCGAIVRLVNLGDLDIPMLRKPGDFATAPPDAIALAQDAVSGSSHVVVIFPLWLGAMPAVVKAFFEQLCRNNFAIETDPRGNWPKQNLKGRSARVIVTMGMPALAYRFLFGAHGVKAFRKSILGISGIGPIRESLIGSVGALTEQSSRSLLARMRRLGASMS